MQDLNDLAILARLADRLSFDAARELGLSASTVSRRIAAMERRLGIALVQRTTRSVRMTAAGTDYAAHCRGVLEAAARAESALQTYRDEIRGDIRLDAPVLFGRVVLSPIVAKFAVAHPLVRVNLTLNNARVDPVAENVDIVFRTGLLPSSGLRMRRLADAPTVVVASDSCLARHGTPRTLAELADLPCVCFDHCGDTRWRCGTLPEPIAVKAAFVANDLEVLRDVAAAGLGFALLPRFLVEAALRDGQLRVVQLDGTFAPVPVSIVFPGHRIPNRGAQALADHVAAALARIPGWSAP